MFSLAIKSGIPIISAHTTDTVNVQAVIEEIAGESVSQAPDKMSGLAMHKSCRVFWTTKHLTCDENLYSELVAKGKSLVVINHPDPGQLAFSVGTIPTPKKLMRDLLEQVLPEHEVEGMMSCFSGLTLKDLGEVARLTMVRDNALTSQGVLHTRALLASKTQGLQQIDTSMGIYVPYGPLKAWVGLNKPFFIDPPDPRLIPRGLLLQGPPGTGKTEAAKFIANQWKIPAYRLDLTSALGRYVGESEGNVLRVLNTLDQEEPCLVPGTLVHTTKGNLEVEELYHRWMAGEDFSLKGVNPDTETPCNLQMYGMIRRKGKPSLRISTEKNCIEVTEDHKLLVDRNGIKVWVEARNLEIGDDLVEVPNEEN